MPKSLYICPECGANLVVKETITTAWLVDPTTGTFDSSLDDRQERVSTFLICENGDGDLVCEYYRIITNTCIGVMHLYELSYKETE